MQHLVELHGGRVAAVEGNASGSDNSPVSGSISVSGTIYTISGTINTDTGVYALATTPALPATVPVVVEGFIDFERSPELTPTIIPVRRAVPCIRAE